MNVIIIISFFKIRLLHIWWELFAKKVQENMGELYDLYYWYMMEDKYDLLKCTTEKSIVK